MGLFSNVEERNREIDRSEDPGDQGIWGDLKKINNWGDLGPGAEIGNAVWDWMADPTGKKASELALERQMEQYGEGIDTIKNLYAQSREDLRPYSDVGVRQLRSLSREMPQLTRTFTMQDFMTDPGYQFRLSEGEKAINRAMGAKGLRQSTAAVKSLNDYNQGMASSEYQKAYDRFNADRDQRYNKLYGLAGMGQQSAGQMANAATQTGQSIADIYLGMGDAQAAQQMGRAGFNQGVTGQVMDFGLGMLGGMFSDQRLKTNVSAISEKDLAELRAAIKPYAFNYIEDAYGEGDWVGVMAQDLEKTKLGKTLIDTNENGHKMINMNKLGSVLLASLGQGV